jgi:uncharacterized membrane protein YdbT with pleckstrin-like domain
MTSNSNAQPLRVFHSAGRHDVALFLVPLFLLMPALLLVLAMALPALSELMGRTPENALQAKWWWYLVVILFCASFPAGAHLKARLTTKYVIYQNAILAEVGFFQRKSSEVRVQDLRNIEVHQSLLDRILQVGDVRFSSAANAGAEVVFESVSQPLMIKALVKDLQDAHQDGVVDAAEQARIDAHRRA